MNRTPPDDEDELASVLAACDDALAKGDGQARLLKNLEFVRLLRGALPKDSTLTPERKVLPHAVPVPERLGRFSISRELGRGGFGIVYLAFDPRLARTIALKVPRPDVLSTPQLRQRFQHEARAAAALDHPNIVAVHEADETDGVAYIAAAYCPGVTLAKWLEDRTDGVPFDQAVTIITQLADAVEHAHQRGVLHRDLKPGNVLISPIGPISPKITDFGLARTLGEEDPQLTATGAVLGTPNYLAPEQAAGKAGPVGPAVDVYGLGAILYELLTRRPPFTSDSALETLRQVRTEDPIAPRRLRAQVPRDLETICLKCLEKEPGRRYKSADELAADLRRFAAGEPIRARPVGVTGRGVKWMRRNPTLTVLLGAGALAILSASLGIAWYNYDRRDHRERADRVTNVALQEAVAAQGRAEGARRDVALWAGALAAAKKANDFATSGDASPELRDRAGALVAEVERHHRNHRLIDGLAQIQASMGDNLLPTGNQDFPTAALRYEQAFEEYGLNLFKTTPEGAAATLRELGGDAVAIAEALDNWAYVKFFQLPNNPGALRLLAITRVLDPDPLRNRVRDAIVKGDRAGLRRIAAEIDPAGQPVQTLNLVAVMLLRWEPGRDVGPEIDFLLRAQFRHAHDFQINHNLAYALNRADRGDEALPYAVAAVALRENSAAAWQDRAISLWRQGRNEEELAARRRVAELAPQAVYHLQRIAEILDITEQPDEAAKVCRRAAHLVPRVRAQFEGFFKLWSRHGLAAEAIAEYQQAIRETPNSADAHLGLIAFLRHERRRADLVTAYDGLIRLEPKTARHYAQRGEARGYLAELGQARWEDVAADFARACELGAPWGDWYRRALLALHAGDSEQYAAIAREMLARFGTSDDVRALSDVAFICCFAPGVLTDMELPIRLARTCLARTPDSRDFQNTLAVTLFRAGRDDEARREFEKSLQMPDLDIDGFDWLYLAMIHHRQGRLSEARALLAKADAWSASRIDPKSSKNWIYRLDYRLLQAQATAALAK